MEPKSFHGLGRRQNGDRHGLLLCLKVSRADLPATKYLGAFDVTSYLTISKALVLNTGARATMLKIRNCQ